MTRAATVLTLCMVALTSIGFSQNKVEGIDFPSSMRAGSKTLDFNGGGLRQKFFIDLYVGGLYLEEKTSDASKVTNDDKAMAIRLVIVSKHVDRETFLEAVNEGFDKSTGGKTAAIKTEIDQFIGLFKEEFSNGDEIILKYIPASGLTVWMNGNFKGKVKGLEFKKALFGIWFGSDPADKDLKKGMLGK